MKEFQDAAGAMLEEIGGLDITEEVDQISEELNKKKDCK